MSDDTVLPSSFVQRRLWLIQQMAPESTAYNMAFQLPLAFVPDVEALRGALDDLVARHEPLRTQFVADQGEPMQAIAPHGRLALDVHDLRRRGDDARAAAQRRYSAMVAAPFDLAHAPLARASLSIVGDSAAILGLVIHHIIVDATSMRILAEELMALYQARADGRVVVLPEAPVQYADFAAWQRKTMSGTRLQTLSTYWRRRLDGLHEIELVPHRPRARDGRAPGAVHRFEIPADLVRRLRTFSSESGTTCFATLLAAYVATLGRFTGDASIPIGIPVSGRPKPELERVVGPFINSVVMRGDLSSEPTFRLLVQRTSAMLADDLTHQDFPFELLVDTLHWPRRADRNPIFQVMFQLQVLDRRSAAGARAPGAAAASSGDGLEPDALTSQVDLSFIQYETAADTIVGGAVYASDLFDRETIAQLVDGYLTLLADGLQRPDTRASELTLVGSSTRAWLTSHARGETRQWAPHRLDAWLRDAAVQFADRIAVISHDDGAALTFTELRALANGFAAHLEPYEVAERVVAISLPRSPQLVAAVLGVLDAGGAFVYVDPAMPHERRAFIVADCDAAAVIVAHERDADVPGRRYVIANDVTTRADDQLDTERATRDDAPAYAIYTSGSTGQPKGVLISHRAIVNHMAWMLDRFPYGPDERVLQRTPLTFDASVWELFAPLLAGATLVLAPEQRAFDPVRFAEGLRRDRITTLQLVPSLLAALLDVNETNGLASCPSLRRVFCGGEPLTADLRDRFFQQSAAELYNLYGPSETTIDATFHVCDRADRRPFVPIGRPIANVTATVVDAQGAIVPVGVAGELVIGGDAVGLGYINRPELTAQRFASRAALTFTPQPPLPLPLEERRAPGRGIGGERPVASPAHRRGGENTPGGDCPAPAAAPPVVPPAVSPYASPSRSSLFQEERQRGPGGDGEGALCGRAFRTGDRVRRLPDGALEFLGRFDDQVKLRGFRIEPGEIEHVLRGHPSIAKAAVVIQSPSNGDQRLVAFVVGRSATTAAVPIVGSAELHAWLRARLPAHMLPSRIEIVDGLPMTAHGKIDRAALALAPIALPSATATAAGTATATGDAAVIHATAGVDGSRDADGNVSGDARHGDRVLPRDDLERLVCRCFADVLHVPTPAIDDDFFQLGGHSLLVLSLHRMLAAESGRPVQVVDIFEHPTPRQLARALADRDATALPPGAAPRRTQHLTAGGQVS